MAIEIAALIKPAVDALMKVLERSNDAVLRKNAEVAVREAVRELLLANPNEDEVEARLAVAKAAGIISSEILMAERMLGQVRQHRKSQTRKKAAAKAPAGPKRKKAAKRKVAAKRKKSSAKR